MRAKSVKTGKTTTMILLDKKQNPATEFLPRIHVPRTSKMIRSDSANFALFSILSFIKYFYKKFYKNIFMKMKYFQQREKTIGTV